MAYALSPINLIPDVIPVLGYLDDLILVPLGILLVVKMIPWDVLVECRKKAEAAMGQGKPTRRNAAIVIIGIWLVLGILAVIWVAGILKR